MGWCDSQPEPIREFGFNRVYTMHGLSPLQMEARLRGISTAEARKASQARAKYGSAFNDIRI